MTASTDCAMVAITMSDDDRTITDTMIHAVRGKSSRRHDRRDEDKMHLKDWLGYILAVVMPIAGALLIMWQSMAVMENRMDRFESGYEKQWEKLSDHLENHP